MYKTYLFSDNNIKRNLPAALKDWTETRQQPPPKAVTVNPSLVATAQTLTDLEVRPLGGCLAFEVWLEVGE